MHGRDERRWWEVQVRVLSLEEGSCLKALSSQQVTSPAESLLFLESPSMGQTGTEEGAGVGALFLHIGALLSVAFSSSLHLMQLAGV